MQSPDDRYEQAKTRLDALEAKVPRAHTVVQERMAAAKEAVSALEEAEKQLAELQKHVSQATGELEEARRCLPVSAGVSHGVAGIATLDATVASISQEALGVDLGSACLTSEESQSLTGAVASLSVLQLALGRLRIAPTQQPPPNAEADRIEAEAEGLDEYEAREAEAQLSSEPSSGLGDADFPPLAGLPPRGELLRSKKPSDDDDGQPQSRERSRSAGRSREPRV